jgi:hypothetical protein
MGQNIQCPRYIPLTQHGLDGNVLLLDSEATLKDLHACAELRVRLVAEFLDAVVSIKDQYTDPCELTSLASAACLLMQEACDLNRVIEKRLWST